MWIDISEKYEASSDGQLNNAFPDIDRRLTELEKRERQGIPVCPGY